jgi:hypothetical protein
VHAAGGDRVGELETWKGREVMRWLIAVFITVAVAVTGLSLDAAEAERESLAPERGFVPDSRTVVRIAEAVWIPIYGERQIAREKPFKAVLRGDTWFVSGTLPARHVGGTAIAEIAKRDGRILRVTHER